MKELDASDFQGSRKEVVIKEFHNVLALFSFCSIKMRDSEETLVARKHEDVIRNIFIAKYVRKNKQNFLVGYLNFDVEGAEIDPVTFESIGYIDIKVTNLAGQGEINDEDFCYVFECKRIKSSNRTELKNGYVDQGILRFINGKYSKFMKIAGMIGFVETSKLEPFGVAEGINVTLSENLKVSTIEYLTVYNEVKLENQCFFSIHIRENGLGAIKIVHMFPSFSIS